jgi:hypothetical protein
MPIPERVTVAAADPGVAHFRISMIKSLLRIAGCGALIFGSGLIWFAVLFLIAELLGILEEIL